MINVSYNIKDCEDECTFSATGDGNSEIALQVDGVTVCILRDVDFKKITLENKLDDK